MNHTVLLCSQKIQGYFLRCTLRDGCKAAGAGACEILEASADGRSDACQSHVRAGCPPPMPAVNPVITTEPQTMMGAAPPVHEAVELQLLCTHGGHNAADAPDLHVRVSGERFGGNAVSRPKHPLMRASLLKL